MISRFLVFNNELHWDEQVLSDWMFNLLNSAVVFCSTYQR